VFVDTAEAFAKDVVNIPIFSPHTRPRSDSNSS